MKLSHHISSLNDQHVFQIRTDLLVLTSLILHLLAGSESSVINVERLKYVNNHVVYYNNNINCVNFNTG